MGADCSAVDAVMAAVYHGLGQCHGNGLPGPGFTPSSELPIDGVPTAIFGQNVAPWSAATEPPKYAVDNRAVLLRRPALSTIFRLDWQQAFQNTPFSLGEIASVHACFQKAVSNQPTGTQSTLHTHCKFHVLVPLFTE